MTDVTYTHDDRDLMPIIPSKEPHVPVVDTGSPHGEAPILAPVEKPAPLPMIAPVRTLPVPRSMTSLVPLYAGAIATIVIVVGVGFVSMKDGARYAAAKPAAGFAAIASVFAGLGDLLEEKLTHELLYVRRDTVQ